jgi:serine/threonine-protein kinase
MSSSSDLRGPVGLLADELLARCKRGERPTIKQYCDRHPDLADEVRDVFEVMLMVEDLRPGTEVAYASGDRLKLIESIRHTEAASPRSIDARTPRDLETIVMKAIDKDPRRRYQSADEMAEDLQRVVNDEPIKARRIGVVEWFGRWCRRNPVVAGLTAAVLVLMAVGTTVSIWQAVVATLAQRDLAAKKAALADEQAGVELALKAIAVFHTGVSEDALLKNPEFKELRTKLLKEAAGFYADLEKLLAGKTDAKSRKLLATGYFQLGDLTAKIGDQKEALAVQRKALALRRELAAAEGVDVETRLEVARSLRAVGNLFVSTGDMAGALSAFEEQRDLAKALEAEAPTDAVRTQLAYGHHGIGFVLLQTGRPADGLKEYQKALAVQQKLADASPAVTVFQRDLAQSHFNIGHVLQDTGKLPEALEEQRKALAIRQKLADASPAVTELQRDLALSHSNIGDVLSRTGKPAEALAELHKALAIQQKLVDANPAVTELQRDLAWSHHHIGDVLSHTGKQAEALQEHHKALAIRQKLADANPVVTGFQRDLARSHNAIADVLSQMGKPAEALKEQQKARDIGQRLAEVEAKAEKK